MTGRTWAASTETSATASLIPAPSCAHTSNHDQDRKPTVGHSRPRPRSRSRSAHPPKHDQDKSRLLENSRPRRRLRGLCDYRWSERRVQPAAVVRHRVRAVGVPEERRVHDVAPELRVRVLRRRHGAHHACGHEQRPDRSAKRCLLVPQLLLDLEPIDTSDR